MRKHLRFKPGDPLTALSYGFLEYVIANGLHTLRPTLMFERILVAVDGSPFADRALSYAVDLAKKYASNLIILHVVLRRFYAVTPSEAGVLATAVYVKEMEAEGQEIIEKAGAYVMSAS
jgi:nucleotide-binding universal stress UspA family protein